ncbi:hypothetical protein Aeqsu_2683 [Aequorivita sublithincola DSM 14238]|uniref:Uncharacterized protein n=1 Tax=Aequorivita sublithincola (strain DSM 14238 / LMG 21431 / ACAM 643 / 9-3) TaxID=746697 RepID=I3YYR7_AEQSU|nr:hypothetical protein Aeqsu_2683 [Aequorivita sublithincola DSM 14238]
MGFLFAVYLIVYPLKLVCAEASAKVYSEGGIIQNYTVALQ